ncbi:hypothetical protein WJX72_003162 [[Myrmecia] bisecta]|uniref:tetraacyldisaccharide 4'-kinase n=1 Tax=[Myrmecia] bisecta TaxID=41462 RepID=A0AAW1QEI8_9CHLO
MAQPRPASANRSASANRPSAAQQQPGPKELLAALAVEHQLLQKLHVTVAGQINKLKVEEKLLQQLLEKEQAAHAGHEHLCDLPWASRAVLAPLLDAAADVRSLGQTARRGLYDVGLLPRARLPVPTISVGSLTYGGSGTSPMAEFLARHFMQDAFLCPLLHRDLDVVMVNVLSPFGNGRLAPRGPLREAPVSALQQAGLVVMHHANLVGAGQAKAPELQPLDRLKGAAAVCCVSIGCPQALSLQLAHLEVALVEGCEPPRQPGHMFTMQELQQAVARQQQLQQRFPQAVILITEKDYVRQPELMQRVLGQAGAAYVLLSELGLSHASDLPVLESALAGALETKAEYALG